MRPTEKQIEAFYDAHDASLECQPREHHQAVYEGLSAALAVEAGTVSVKKHRIVDILRETTEAMACLTSVNMCLWDRHSNACLEAATEIECMAKTEDRLRKIIIDLQNERTCSAADPRDRLIGNLLDRWEMTPNDLKDEMREHGCGKQLDALLSALTTSPASSGVEGEAVAWQWREALQKIADMRWSEDADLDDICTIADRALASPAPQTEGR